MTAIKGILNFLDENIKTVPKVSKDSLILNLVRNRLIELVKKDKETYGDFHNWDWQEDSRLDYEEVIK